MTPIDGRLLHEAGPPGLRGARWIDVRTIGHATLGPNRAIFRVGLRRASSLAFCGKVVAA